jgi:transcriptional regulator GlxA family with amidase domain
MLHSADPVRLACSFIHANAHLAIGLTEIAEAARLSKRGLQHAFKKQLGVAPTAYLRSVRLALAHDELQSADSRRKVTVSQVARHWHFGHQSRFAALYIETYGHYPAETLRTAP